MNIIKPKDGSRWWGGNDTFFRVLHTVEIDGHVWIHYVKENSVPAEEYSCYIESFLQRFNKVPE
jgi:hypothetical protein